MKQSLVPSKLYTCAGTRGGDRSAPPQMTGEMGRANFDKIANLNVGMAVLTLGLVSMARKSSESFPRAQRPRMKRGPMRKLSTGQKRDIAAIRAKKDQTIDFSDIPAVVDWSGAEIGKFYRPAKKSVTMRLDEDVVSWLKTYGKGYQTRANLLLRHAMASTEQGAPATAARPRQARRSRP